MIENMVCSVHSVLRTSKLKYLVHPGAKYSLTTLFSITFDIVDKHSEHHHVEIDVLRVDFGGDVSNLISWYCLKQGYIMLYTYDIYIYIYPQCHFIAYTNARYGN